MTCSVNFTISYLEQPASCNIVLYLRFDDLLKDLWTDLLDHKLIALNTLKTVQNTEKKPYG